MHERERESWRGVCVEALVLSPPVLIVFFFFPSLFPSLCVLLTLLFGLEGRIARSMS